MPKPNIGEPSATPALAYSITDVCRITSIGRTPLYMEIRTGKLKARKAGRRTLILYSDLQQWLGSLPAVGAK